MGSISTWSFIEHKIQTVKHVMNKARQSGQDIDLALLCLRTTPIDSKLPSPADLINGRKPQSSLLTKIVDRRQDHGELRERLQERQDTMAYQHYQHARDPRLFTTVKQFASVIKMVDGNLRRSYKTPNPRSYILATPSTSMIRRNRNHTRQLDSAGRQ